MISKLNENIKNMTRTAATGGNPALEKMLRDYDKAIEAIRTRVATESTKTEGEFKLVREELENKVDKSDLTEL